MRLRSFRFFLFSSAVVAQDSSDFSTSICSSAHNLVSFVSIFSSSGHTFSLWIYLKQEGASWKYSLLCFLFENSLTLLRFTLRCCKVRGMAIDLFSIQSAVIEHVCDFFHRAFRTPCCWCQSLHFVSFPAFSGMDFSLMVIFKSSLSLF